MNESRHTYTHAWVTSHIWMRHVTHIYKSRLQRRHHRCTESRHKHTHINESGHTWLIHIFETTHSYARHVTSTLNTPTNGSSNSTNKHHNDPFTTATHESCGSTFTHSPIHSCTRVTRLIQRPIHNPFTTPSCLMTHAHVWHDSFIWKTRLIHMCDTTHLWARHDNTPTRGSSNSANKHCRRKATRTWYWFC